MKGALVVLVCGESGECLNRGAFQKGILEIGHDKGWVVRRDGVAGAEKADGVIVYGVDGRMAVQVERSVGGRKVVWAQRVRPESGSGVVLDEEEIGRMGVRHFAEAGFSQVGVLLGNGEGCALRWEGVRSEAVELSVEVAGFRLDGFGKGGMEAVTEMAGWLDSFSEPVGVLMPSDRWGLDVLNAAEMAGLKVPEQVGVLGVGNDTVECAMGRVGISSVEANVRLQGELAARELDRMMRSRGRNTAVERVVSPGGVALRASSDVRAVPHLKASMALRFIRRNYGEVGLSVDRVAEEVGMSRRGLEDAFRNHLRQGIGRTITEMRIRIAKEILVETRRKVGEVAVSVGFQNAQYFHRCFSKIVGVTPAKFRRMREGMETADGR